MEIKVRSGDTLEYYSQLFSIPKQLIIDSNPGLDCNHLHQGTQLKIPGFTLKTYKIRRQDQLRNLIQSLNLNGDALLLVNQALNLNNLGERATIHLPLRVTSSVAQRPNHYDFSQLTTDIEKLESIYPFMTKRMAGNSIMAAPLYDLRIGKGSRKVQINAAFHANEWITTAVLMKFINEYLLAITNDQDFCGVSAITIYKHSQLSAVPMVNPDGVNLVLNGPPKERAEELIQLNRGSSDFSGWKANVRGVDLNKQFPAKWEFEKQRLQKVPGPRDFPGTTPISEPETRAMARLVNDENFDRLLALHTQGKEIYWGYDGLEPPESAILAKDFERVSGYKAVRYVDSYVGYKDWFIQQFRKPGFTIELGSGENPLPISQFDEIYTDVKPLLVRSFI